MGRLAEVRRPTHLFAAFILAACSLALAVPFTADAAEKSIWGPIDLPDGGSAFPTYRALGVDTLQMSMSMAQVAPTRPRDINDPADPAYHWPARIDEAVRRGRATGVRVMVLMLGSPSWANGGRSPVWAPKPQEWAAMMAAASRRYPVVRRWMVWGEPSRVGQFRPNVEQRAVGPRTYAKILDASYVALKRVSRSNIVIGGNTFSGGDVRPYNFLKLMRLPNGKLPRLDWFGHNPFPFRYPNLRYRPVPGGWRDISDLETFSAEVRSTYGPRVKLWLSEFTIQSGHASSAFELFVSPRKQGEWLSAAFRIADEVPGIAGMGWVGLLDQPPAPLSPNFGLMTSIGARKPAYSAFRSAPSVRWRPAVRAPKATSAAAISSSGVRVVVTPRIGGAVTVRLLRGGRSVAVKRQRLSAGRARSLTLRWAQAVRGSALTVAVKARGGATVRSRLQVR